MSITITLLTVFLVMVSILLVLVTLMQRPKQEGLGAAFGGGMMNDTFGAQTTDVLQKSTVWLAGAFFGASILLTVLNTHYYESQRDVGNILEEVRKPEPFPTLPTPEANSSAPIIPGIPSPVVPDSKEAAPKAEKADKAEKGTPAPAPEPATKSSAAAKPAAEPAKPATEKKPAADKAPAKADSGTPAAETKDAK